MEECKSMGIKVLGPDINESQKGFAVNNKEEIRLGLGGLKGVGEAAIESIISERNKNGLFKSVFDMIKRVNQRSVNKKTLESLVYAGAFDCFSELHRAQYFYTSPEDNSTGLEKIIRYGQVCQNASESSANTLFGNLSESMQVPPPKIATCDPWPLIVQLDFEKEVTGIFISGHPLDNYRFEMENYGITQISFLNKYGENTENINANAVFRVMGLVSDAQHRISKNGNRYGSFTIEDYSGKLNITLFSEDYLKFSPILQIGSTVFLTGYFKKRFNGEYSFNLNSLLLAESVKKNLTKKLSLKLPAEDITDEVVQFVYKNFRKNKGNATLALSIYDKNEDIRIDLFTTSKGFEMNDEFISFLQAHPYWGVNIIYN